VRLKLSHEELMLIRSSVQRIVFGVFVIAAAVVASVWHHW
jgi:prepilin signal peptidase PulO-like enzyme (type II secretory pathway)